MGQQMIFTTVLFDGSRDGSFVHLRGGMEEEDFAAVGHLAAQALADTPCALVSPDGYFCAGDDPTGGEAFLSWEMNCTHAASATLRLHPVYMVARQLWRHIDIAAVPSQEGIQDALHAPSQQFGAPALEENPWDEAFQAHPSAESFRAELTRGPVTATVLVRRFCLETTAYLCASLHLIAFAIIVLSSKDGQAKLISTQHTRWLLRAASSIATQWCVTNGDTAYRVYTRRLKSAAPAH